MKKLFIYSWLPMLFAAMATFSFTACGGGDGDEEFPVNGGSITAPASIIGKWKLMTIDREGKETGDYQIHCYNADGTGYYQQFNIDGTCNERRSYTYTFDGSNIYIYDESGELEDALLNVTVTATTLTATGVTGFTATMTKVNDDEGDTPSAPGGDEDNSDNDNTGGDTPTTPDTPSVTAGAAIDLGLSVKWASCNVGATKPEEYGGYYAWGETEEKNSYYESDYLYYNNGSYTNIGSDISGTQYDVATVKWGGNWRMPTAAEIDELTDNCTWQWTTVNGVKGHRVTGPNGNSIFLPAAGSRSGQEVNGQGSGGLCWSSSLNSSYSYYAYSLYFYSGSFDRNFNSRYFGRTVRPVCK